MKHLSYLLFAFILVSGCAKEDKLADNRCEHPSCAKYYHAWQSVLSKRNNLPDTYFKKHIIPGAYTITENRNGELFTIDYKVIIDWAVIDLHDQFMIKIYNGEDVFPGKNVRRDVYFSESEIDAMISYASFNAEMNEFKSVEKLGFASATEAMNAMRAKAKTNEIYFNKYGFKKSTAGFRANGHPYMFGLGNVNPLSKTRLIGEIDLVSMDISTYALPVQNKSTTPYTP